MSLQHHGGSAVYPRLEILPFSPRLLVWCSTLRSRTDSICLVMMLLLLFLLLFMMMLLLLLVDIAIGMSSRISSLCTLVYSRYCSYIYDYQSIYYHYHNDDDGNDDNNHLQ